jgi:hypothetical protein
MNWVELANLEGRFENEMRLEAGMDSKIATGAPS